MFFKLALRNVRRSARDYAIYFVTVMLGVAMFYAFNALESQSVMFDALSVGSLQMLGLLNMMVTVLSYVVACVLGFLVVYANRFLICRRRREFGTYLLFGMGASRVSRILLYETVVVGLASLVVGLVVGILASQGLSFATAALMGTTMSKYHFIVSLRAILMTIVCFAVIFALSAIVDIIYIRRCKLITLLNTHDSSESYRIPRLPLRVAGFVVSVIVLALAYWQLNVNGMQWDDEHFWIATVLMVIGTFLFFWSVAGFVTAVIVKSERVYLRGIRMFTVRQLSSKMNTTFASMGVICIMLFFALTIASVGLGLVQVFTDNINESTFYDATINAYPCMAGDEENDSDGSSEILYQYYQGDMAACLSDRSDTWDRTVRASAQLDYYRTNVLYGVLLEQIGNVAVSGGDEILEEINGTIIHVVGVSQYNDVCQLTGKPALTLAADEFAVNNVIDGYEVAAQALAAQSAELTVANAALHCAKDVQHVAVRTSSVPDAALEIIVPDTITAALAAQSRPFYSYLDVMYATDRVTGDTALYQALNEVFPPDPGEWIVNNGEVSFVTKPWPTMNVYTAQYMIDQAGGLRMVISYLAIYIGFVLLVATAAILAIQQLSETADSMKRYARLSALGCDERKIFGSLRAQTVTYFLAPLVLAACHTTCAVLVITHAVFDHLGVDVTGSVMLAAGIVLVIYILYLAITYALSRNIVQTSIRHPLQSGE